MAANIIKFKIYRQVEGANCQCQTGACDPFILNNNDTFCLEKLDFNLFFSKLFFKDQLVTKEHQLKQVESENKLFEEQNKTHETTREKLEKDLRNVSSKKEDLENQFTALTLQKVFYFS